MKRIGATGRVGRRAASTLAAILAGGGLAVATVGLVVPASPASAASCGTFTWTGVAAAAGNDNWSSGLNWQGGAAPSPNTCASLVFPFTAAQTGTANNDIANLEIVALNITGAFTLTGNGVFMGDSSTPATVSASANSTIGLSQNLQNSTTYAVSTGNTLTDSGSVVGSTAATELKASGPGTLVLAAANTFTGPSQINGGTVEVTNQSGLGQPANAVAVASGSTLQLGPNPAVSPFTIQQPVTDAGTVVGSGPDERLSNQLTLAAGGGALAGAGKLTVAQITSGPASVGLTVNPNGFSGTVVLGGGTSNDYTGGTTVDGGVLNLDVTPASGTATATPGSLTVDSGAAVTLSGPGQLDPASGLTVVGTGSVDIQNNPASISTLTLNSTSNASGPTVKSTGGSGPLTVTSDITSKGTGLPSVISAGLNLSPSPQPVNVQTIDSLVMTGALTGGALTLATSAPSFPFCTSGTSTNTCTALVITHNSSAYTGQVTLSSGVLDVTGTLSATPVSVEGGVLTGTGTVNNLTMSSGSISPGSTVSYVGGANLTSADSPGVLSASSLAASGGALNVRIDGTSPGNGSTTCSGYDQLDIVAGPTSLGAAAANLNVASDKGSNAVPCLVPSNGQHYTIVPSPATSGTFKNDQSGTVQGNPYQYTISYTGGTSGHDVILTSTVNDTVTVSSSGPNPSTYGEQLKFTATVGTASGVPTGTVAFTDAATNGPVTIVCNESTSNPKNGTVPLSGGTASCTPTSALPGGSNTITGTYSGDATFTSNLGTVSQTVNPQPTSTAVSGAAGNPNPSTYGETVTFTATITLHPTANAQSPTTTPGGTVTFFAAGSPLGDCTAVSVATSSGTTTATCNTSQLPTGSDKVTATYTGDSNYGTSTDSTGVNQTVGRASTTTALSNGSPSPSVFGQPVSFIATVSPGTVGPSAPGGTVTFSANGTPISNCTNVNVATVNGTTTAACNTSQLPVGNPAAVTAVYNGDGTNYSASSPSNTVDQTVNQANTTTTLKSSANPSFAGEQVIYTATVAAAAPGSGTPTGTVTFMDGTNLVNCGTGTQNLSTSAGVTSASCAVTYLISGSHSITATYNGDGNFLTSTSSALSQNVVAGATTTSVSNGSPSTSVYGQQVTFTATITPNYNAASSPTGNVAFSANGTALPDCSTVAVATNGGVTTATCQTIDLPVGNPNPVSVIASYNGDSNYATSTSGSVSQNVNKAATATALSTGSPDPSVFGQPVTFTATVSAPGGAGPAAPTGTVTFKSGGSALGACSAVPLASNNGTATATCTTGELSVGSDSVTATYNGDGNYAASAPSSGQTQTVNPDATRVTVTSSSNPAAAYQSITFTATVAASPPGAGSPTGAVEFTDPGSPISGCTAQPLTTSGGMTTATCTVSFSTIGDREVSAVYLGDANFAGNTGNSVIQKVVHSVAPAGYWLVASDGGIFSFGPRANFYGSTGAIHLNKPIVGMAEDPATGGYWLVASDGGVFAFNAPFFGSTGSIHLNAPIVAMVAAPDGNGYWLVASDGGIFSFGSSAHFYGSTGAIHLNKPIVGMAAAPDGNGYWLVASDGGIFSFGPSATFFGSAGATPLNQPVVGMAAAPDGNGYWLVASDGGIFSFGPSAQFFGSTGAVHLNQPIVGMAAAPDGNGYWLVASDGGVFAFGPSAGFYGSMGAVHLNKPVVGIAAAG